MNTLEIKDEYLREKVQIAPNEKKMVKSGLRLFDQLSKRPLKPQKKKKELMR